MDTKQRAMETLLMLKKTVSEANERLEFIMSNMSAGIEQQAKGQELLIKQDYSR